jgi:hypothetical protein
LPTPLTSVGPYRIERELGRGGMGVVYLGHDPRLGRAVALKALPEHLAGDPDRLARFEREARTLASLSHPGIAGIYGLEEASGQRYLVLPLVHWDPLALSEILRREVPRALAADNPVCRPPGGESRRSTQVDAGRRRHRVRRGPSRTSWMDACGNQYAPVNGMNGESKSSCPSNTRTP